MSETSNTNPAIEHTQRLMDATAKLDIGEPLFILRAQDVTAALMVETWVTAQQLLRSELDAMTPLHEAVQRVRVYLNIPRVETLMEDANEKERGALEIAKQMQQWPNWKIAD